MSTPASDLATRLGLRPHPEGGSFTEIFRSDLMVRPEDGRPPRAALTAIYYLLDAGQHSRWHAVSSDEQWTLIDGDGLDLFIAGADGTSLDRVRLGSIAAGGTPVAVVRAGCWQAARPTGGHALVTCTVGPGFDDADFRFLAADSGEADRLSPVLGELAGLIVTPMSDPSDRAPATETWTVWRQDDSGNKDVVSAGHDRANAERIVREFEARGHKQTYWIERDRAGGA